MTKILYSAIVFMDNNLAVRKYRNINNIDNFTKFCQKIGALYYNLYEKETKKFIKRIYT